jgi:pimeloyl-ACP methyl ester carboxylesterase
MRSLLLVFLSSGCVASSSGGVAPIVEGSDFFDRPFPSDARRVDGHPDLTGFPGEGDYPLVDAYLNTSQKIDGFGTNSPIYVRFEEPIDTTLLPTPEESLALDSPVMLVDVDRASPHRGERVPVVFEWTADKTTFQPGNLLATAPVFGFPLHPHTTYALVLRRPLVAPAGGQDWGVGGDPSLLPVEETLTGLGVSSDDVSLAVVFTTQDPVAETARIAHAIREEIGLPVLDQQLTTLDDRGQYTLYRGSVDVPVWQHGDRPYRSEGGAFEFAADGTPEIAFWERVHFALTIPHGTEPDGGWPVVLYSHGTGGDYLTFCESGDNDEEGTVMARDDVAMFGISQPLHADRAPPGTNPDLDSFNYTNPDAGRTNFRQGALDQVYLAELLTRQQATFAADGDTIHLDRDRVAFFGHSQGGLVGALAAPFFSDRLRAAGFSGTGGGLAMTVVLRKDPLDIAALISTLLSFDAGEELTTFHPVVGLIQMLSEVTDPLNYGPWWFAEEPSWDAAPMSILLTEGLHDQDTPSVTTEALAAAARVPIVGVPATSPEALELRGLSPDDLPAADNAVDWNGRAITAGLGQFPDNDHFAIYHNHQAKQIYQEFLSSALSGETRLDE